MFGKSRSINFRIGGTALFLLVLAGTFAYSPAAMAQNGYNYNERAVGGVHIDASGMLNTAAVADLSQQRDAFRKLADDTPADLKSSTQTRKVSLRGLELIAQKCAQSGERLPASAFCLGGLQRIEYVLVYPEKNDIVLVGPGEGWKADERGNLVGVTTGRPVMQLDDLIVALRNAVGQRPTVISCSIDPTQEGLKRLAQYAKTLSANDISGAVQGIVQQLGPQQITVQGIAEDSHFARVMVAADYRMKRISMGLDPSPVAALKSFTTMIKASGRGMNNMLPRWWLAPNYQPPLRDVDGLTWQLRGGSVKAMCEDDFMEATGMKRPTGKADAGTQRWADAMTANYETLSKAEPIFGELRNCMDLAVVAALVAKENLLTKANLSLPTLLNSDALRPAKLPVAHQVSSESVVAKQGHKWLIAAGGVQINPWEIVRQPESSDTLTTVRQQATCPAEGQWCSN
jgi:hypothetical protein